MANLLSEPKTFRAFFAARFAEFLKANYQTPEQVAVAFGVRHNTACNWMEGNHRASGDSVALAVLKHPDEFAKFMGDACEPS